jgi:Calcineurin-like phosphoesterase/GTPase-associated adaptor domain
LDRIDQNKPDCTLATLGKPVHPLSPMTKVRIVHVSDIHFGQEVDGSLREQEDVREALIRDCAKMRDQLGDANAVVVTGDVAYAGTKPEYERAGRWLDDLCNAAHCDTNAVHTIPGNHDIDWKKIDFTVELLHKELRTCDADAVNETLHKIAGNDHANPTAGAIALFRKLADYREFASRYQSDFTSEVRPTSTKELRFPSGHVLRFLGMTSVQISDKHDDVRKMVLGSEQYVFSPEENVEYVVMCHHPFDWFKDKAQAMPRICTRGRLILTGHEHQPAFRKIEERGAEYLMLDAGATNPPGSEKRSPHCYNWIEFELLEKDSQFSLEVSVHPRVWVPDLAAFGADSNRIAGANSSSFSVKCPNYSKIPTIDAAPAATAPSIVIDVPGREAAMPDEARFAKLLYYFWRYLDWQQRYGVLARADVLPKGLDRPVPQVLERNALAAAQSQGKLATVWDEVMKHVPEPQRERNPFN